MLILKDDSSDGLYFYNSLSTYIKCCCDKLNFASAILAFLISYLFYSRNIYNDTSCSLILLRQISTSPFRYYTYSYSLNDSSLKSAICFSTATNQSLELKCLYFSSDLSLISLSSAFIFLMWFCQAKRNSISCLSSKVCTFVSKLSIVSWILASVSVIYCDGSTRLGPELLETVFLIIIDWRGSI